MSQAQAQRLRAALHSFTLPNEIPLVLLDAARALEPLDPRLARDTYTEAIEAVLVSGQLTKGTTRTEIAHAALSMLEMDDRGFITELSVWATNPD